MIADHPDIVSFVLCAIAFLAHIAMKQYSPIQFWPGPGRRGDSYPDNL
jgi:hypothetical protein